MRKVFPVVLIPVFFLLLEACAKVTPKAPAPEAKVAKTEVEEPSLESEAVDDLLDEYKTTILAEDESTITIIDARGREVIISKYPERVILLQNSLLDLWYLAGGTAIARVSGSMSVPEPALDLPEVGNTTSPNTELLLAQTPDLVVLNAKYSSHIELEAILTENEIPFFYTGTSINPYENILKSLYVFTRLTGDEEAYQQNVLAIVTQVQTIVDSVEGKPVPDVLVLFGSSKYVKAEMENGLVGEMVRMLGGVNVVKNVEIEGEARVDFSLEAILEADPDVILISVSGKVEDVEARMAEDIESNEAWNSLRAVQEGRVYYLPKDLYLYKPNARYPEALQGLAEILYP